MKKLLEKWRIDRELSSNACSNMKFKLKDIQPNPFRNLDSYPIRKDKLETLRESLQSTGYWDNVVARMGDDGFPQIAYGHHRLAALREEYPPDHEVNLIIKDLSNDQMLRIMARENMDEWGSNAQIEMETVRATLDAYAAGQIEGMPEITKGTPPANIYYINNKPYNGATLARYLGWQMPSKPDQPNKSKMQVVLGALRLIDEGYAQTRDYEGLSTRVIQTVSSSIRKANLQAQEDARGADSQGSINERLRANAQQVFQIAKNVTRDGGGSQTIQRAIDNSGIKTKPRISRAAAENNDHSVLRYAMSIENLLKHDDLLVRRIHTALNKKLEPDSLTRLSDTLTALLGRTQELLDTLHSKSKTH